MNYKSKYNFHQTVFGISKTTKVVCKLCTFCDGWGEIEHKNRKLTCPDCRGKSHVTVGTKQNSYVVSLTIGKVVIEHTCSNDKDYDQEFIGRIRSCGVGSTNYGAQKEKYKESYMCYETGIGTGTIHYSNELFSTRKEAQKECDNRNKAVI